MVVEHKAHQGGFNGLINRINSLSKRAVYVGIQQKDTSRKEDSINNAELLYIHTHGIRRRSMINEMNETMASGAKYSKAMELYIHSHGSPLWHSPPRPVIEPAIEFNKNKIAQKYADVVKATAQGDIIAIDNALNTLGLFGQNIARGWFRDPNNRWKPNSEETIKRKGSANPLIDTAQLRKAINYVIK